MSQGNNLGPVWNRHVRGTDNNSDAETPDLFRLSPAGESQKKAFIRSQYELNNGDSGSMMNVLTSSGLGGYGETRQEKEKRLKDQFWEQVIRKGLMWLSQTRMIGGLEMTNAQIMEARNDILEHKDHYADWALKNKLLRADQLAGFWAYMALKQRNDDLRAKGQDVPEADLAKEQEGDEQFGETHDKFVDHRNKVRGYGKANTVSEQNILDIQKSNGTERDDIESAAYADSLTDDFAAAHTGQELPALPSSDPKRATRQTQIAIAETELKESFAQASAGPKPQNSAVNPQSPEPDSPETPLPEIDASNLGF
ncbi:MAG: hypothetical protein AB7S78_14180 [Candidatus Omnitrophota bacterium]